MITIWTDPGSTRHCELCESFLEYAGFVVARDALHVILTMETRYDLGGRTCWRLTSAACLGSA
jgi:hypothetical protein